MKKTLLALAIVAALAAGQNAYATPVTQTFADTAINWAEWTDNVTNPAATGDTYGTPTISSTFVTTDNFDLNYIAFQIGNAYTGVKSGDLFIDANADKTWDYVVKSYGFTLDSNAILAAGLYAINVGLTDDAKYLTATATNERTGHATGLADMTTARYLGSVGYASEGTVSPYYVAFDFTGLNTALSFDRDFIIGYTFTCANDVVYQQVPVPEPGTFAMLGAGLLGLGLFARRKKQL